MIAYLAVGERRGSKRSGGAFRYVTRLLRFMKGGSGLNMVARSGGGYVGGRGGGVHVAFPHPSTVGYETFCSLNVYYGAFS